VHGREIRWVARTRRRSRDYSGPLRAFCSSENGKVLETNDGRLSRIFPESMKIRTSLYPGAGPYRDPASLCPHRKCSRPPISIQVQAGLLTERPASAILLLVSIKIYQ
jgi:hypothetical protein